MIGTERKVRTYEAFTEIAPRPRVVTIGTFDGVHRGHAFLLASTVERARELGASALAVTFEPIPAMVLRPDRFAGRICSADTKLSLLQTSGLDEIVTLEFTRELSQQSPEEFMEALARAACPVEIRVGEAFALGKNRVGDVARLRAIGSDLGFEVVAIPRLANGEVVISSSAIRRAVLTGDADLAYRLLGRPFRVSGEVIHGAHLGRTIGYPTANMVPPPEQASLADGIYASYATLPDPVGPRPAMTYVGTRPTVNRGERQVETHLLDFDGDLYGQVIHVDVVQRLRGDATFAGVDALIAQLRLDEAAARTALAARSRAQSSARVSD